MSTTEWLIVIAAVLILAGLAWFAYQWQRRRHLTGRFGPEYERTLESTGSRSEAERALKEREARVAALHIRALAPEERRRFADEWRRVQARFVDEPGPAVEEADNLIREVMQQRGYPVGDFERRTEDLSVDHPQVVQHYRAGHELAARSRDGRADTEDLRQAMVHYRALFQELLEEEQPERDRSGSGARWRNRREKEVNLESAE
jgi:hypothetical protein